MHIYIVCVPCNIFVTDLPYTTIPSSACTPHTLTPPSPSFSYHFNTLDWSPQTFRTTSSTFYSTSLHQHIYSWRGKYTCEIHAIGYMYIMYMYVYNVLYKYL